MEFQAVWEIHQARRELKASLGTYRGIMNSSTAWAHGTQEAWDHRTLWMLLVLQTYLYTLRAVTLQTGACSRVPRTQRDLPSVILL